MATYDKRMQDALHLLGVKVIAPEEPAEDDAPVTEATVATEPADPGA